MGKQIYAFSDNFISVALKKVYLRMWKFLDFMSASQFQVCRGTVQEKTTTMNWLD